MGFGYSREIVASGHRVSRSSAALDAWAIVSNRAMPEQGKTCQKSAMGPTGLVEFMT